MCEIKLSDKAVKALRELGCNHHRFLRLSVTGDKTEAILDSRMQPTDEIILEQEGLKVVSSVANLPDLDGSRVECDPSFSVVR